MLVVILVIMVLIVVCRAFSYMIHEAFNICIMMIRIFNIMMIAPIIIMIITCANEYDYACDNLGDVFVDWLMFCFHVGGKQRQLAGRCGGRAPASIPAGCRSCDVGRRTASHASGKQKRSERVGSWKPRRLACWFVLRDDRLMRCGRPALCPNGWMAMR